MQKPELRVLQVFHGLGMGGAETWLMSLLKYFHEQNKHAAVKVRFDVLLTGGEKAVFDDEAVSLGARLFYVPFQRKTMGGFIRKFRKILREGKYDAIHDHQDYVAGLHFAMGAGVLPPVRIAHVHNPIYRQANYSRGILRRGSKDISKLLIRFLATHVMGTSRQVLEEYGFTRRNFPGITLGAAHCGFDVSAYQCDQDSARAQLCNEFEWPRSAKIVLFVGRLEGESVFHLGRRMTHKNPDFALEVIRECVAEDPGVHLLMVGAGETKRRELEHKVATWQLGGNIRCVAVRHDIPRLMSGSDLLLFPSLAEGLGMVAVEAQAAGLRVLASDTTPRECVVVPELMNFESLAQPPAHWATRCLQLLNLPRIDSRSCNSVVKDSCFSIQNSADSLAKLYGASSSTLAMGGCVEEPCVLPQASV